MLRKQLVVALATIALNMALGGLPQEFGGGFFNRPYTSWEKANAPKTDINNARINTFFIVDNTANPRVFYGMYSFGHADERVCARVSRKELDFVKAAMRNPNVISRQLGFGVTALMSTGHIPAAAELYRWYKDPNTRDKLFASYVSMPKLVAKADMDRADQTIRNWQQLAQTENLITLCSTNVPTTIEVGAFRLAKKPDLSNLLLSQEEIKTIQVYVNEIGGRTFDRIRALKLDKSLQKNLAALKADCTAWTSAFFQKHQVQERTRLHLLITRMRDAMLDENMVLIWNVIHTCNQDRRRHTKTLQGMPEILRKLFSKLDHTALLVALQGSNGQNLGDREIRDRVNAGIKQYSAIQFEAALQAYLLVRTSAKNDAGKKKEIAACLQTHLIYLKQMSQMLQGLSKRESLAAAGSNLQEQTLREQEDTWLNSIYGMQRNFVAAYQGSENYAYFGENNTKITVPLFMDALSRGWPGDKLLAGQSNTSPQITGELEKRFGPAYHALIARAGTYFRYSEDGQAGHVVQPANGRFWLAGAPAKDGAANVAAVLDPWNYRTRLVSREIPAEELIANKRCQDDLKKVYRRSWPVFVADGKTVRMYWGDFKNCLAEETVPAHTPQHVSMAIASLKKRVNITELRRFQADMDKLNAGHVLFVGTVRHYPDHLYVNGQWFHKDDHAAILESIPIGKTVALVNCPQETLCALATHAKVGERIIEFCATTKPSRANMNLAAIAKKRFRASDVEMLNESQVNDLDPKSDEVAVLFARNKRELKQSVAAFTSKLEQARSAKRFKNKQVALILSGELRSQLTGVELRRITEQLLQSGALLVMTPKDNLSPAEAQLLFDNCKEQQKGKLSIPDFRKFIRKAVDRTKLKLDDKEKARDRAFMFMEPHVRFQSIKARKRCRAS